MLLLMRAVYLNVKCVLLGKWGTGLVWYGPVGACRYRGDFGFQQPEAHAHEEHCYDSIKTIRRS